jgi:hypothetical protein
LKLFQPWYRKDLKKLCADTKVKDRVDWSTCPCCSTAVVIMVSTLPAVLAAAGRRPQCNSANAAPGKAYLHESFLSRYREMQLKVRKGSNGWNDKEIGNINPHDRQFSYYANGGIFFTPPIGSTNRGCKTRYPRHKAQSTKPVLGRECM